MPPLGLDGDALRETWAYVFGHDLIKTIRARVGPPDHPLLLLVTEPRRLQLRVGDGVWLRIVDVPAALAAQCRTDIEYKAVGFYINRGEMLIYYKNDKPVAAGTGFALRPAQGLGM